MADKEVIIGTDEVLNVLYGTGVKGSPETNVSTTNTFSGAIVEGSADVAYTLEISKLRYEDMDGHMKLSMKLDKMLFEPDTITIIDTVRPQGETPYQVIDTYSGCVVDGGNSYEINVDDKTAENLKFRCTSRDRQWKPLTSAPSE